jgi:hypothetical protein
MLPGVNGRRASRSALLGLLVLTVSGCGDNAPTPLAPTPLAPTPLPLPSTLEGRVLDEQNQPVGGARITLTSIQPTGPKSGPSVTADDTGSFSLTLNLPANWRHVTLRAGREGYESNEWVFVSRGQHHAVPIKVYRSLTISPGESIQTTVSLDFYACGWFECRRVRVNAPSGTLVDIEVFPADGQEYVGLARRDELSLYPLPRQVTVSGGDDVWIVVEQLGRVTLRAAGR